MSEVELCDKEWQTSYQVHVHVCDKRINHTDDHACECGERKKVKTESGSKEA